MDNRKLYSNIKGMNNSEEKSKEQNAYLVISDSSEQLEKQKDQIEEINKIDARSQKKSQTKRARPIVLEEHENVEDNNAIQKPIKLKTYQQRLNLLQQSRPSKRIKLVEQSQQPARVIRFGAVKNDIDQQEQQQDTQKLQRKRSKKATPWMSKQTKQIEDTCLRLHNETVEFYQYIKPTRRQHETRVKIFNLVSDMIVEKYPHAKVEYFGSFATKLYLPDGDIDITVLLQDVEQYDERKVYDNIHKSIRKNEGTLFCDIQYIRNSKVPLIKFVHIETQLPFDISVNKKDGLVQIQHVMRMKKIYPEFDPLVFVLKTMLKVRNMGETYTGGIGSFLLSCMILHFLRHVHHHNRQCYYTLGEYVMKFMEFYALGGDWERKSIYTADSTEVPRARQPGTLSFYSPQDDSHDIGRSAFKIRDVFNVFKNRFRVISGKNFTQGESILKQLINPSMQQFRYYKYEKLMNKKSE